jgi:hypothetical protein
MRFGIATTLALLFATTAHAQRADTIRGRVVGPDSVPLPGIIITAISLPDSTIKKAGTSDSGTYTIAFAKTSGRYVLTIAVPGFAPARKPAIRAPGDTGAIVVDFRLTHQAQTLAGVRSVATRAKPVGADFQGENGPGATATYINLSNGLSGDASGDLTAALSMIPGLSVIPDPAGGLPSISAFGLSSDQNVFTLNGMTFGGASPPRDGFSLALVTAIYDPMVGGFSGARGSLRMNGGTNTVSRNLHLTLDDPSLQSTTPVASRLGTLYRLPILSGTLAGPIVWDKLYYSTSYQVQQRASELVTLGTEGPQSLEALGISPDSVSRLISALGPLGVPARTSGIPAERTATLGSLYERIDFRPHLPAPGSNFTTEDQYYLIVGGNWNRAEGLAGTTALPAVGGQNSHWDGTLEATATKYLPGSVLNESTVSFGARENRSSPYLDVPTALISLYSTLPDGSSGFSRLQAGGSSTPQSDSRGSMLEAKNVTSWYTWDRTHQYKVGIDVTADRYSNSQSPSFGAFSYNSLSDFETNQPSAFARTLTGRASDGQGVNAAIGIGDIFAPWVNQPQRSQLRIQYGVRLEGNHLGVRPGFNPAVDSMFGLRTDHVPNSVALVPMVGFSQQFARYEYLPGATIPRWTVSGGAREYRNTILSQNIDPYTRQTGLPSAVQQLSCVGSAVPTPDWTSYVQSTGAIPTQCADGSSGSVLAQTTPPVAVLAPDYTLPRSWRGALGIDGYLSSHFSGGITGTWALNTNQVGVYDVNFNPATRFTLASEAGRPIYVTPSSIVPATGGVVSTDSRLFPQFAQVGEARSDLKGEARQVTTRLTFSNSLIGGGFGPSLNATATYTYNDNRDQLRGFASTAGDPRNVSWAPSSNAATHNLGLLVNFQVPQWGGVSAQGIFRSGLPYTPRVNGDINGDGFANDRPFVFNPATTQDSALSAGMRNLLTSAPAAARQCLERALGTIVDRNSCAGPWFSSLNLSVNLDAYRLHLGNRGQLFFTVNNSLAALDQLLHGPGNLQGWGQTPYPDPTLLLVRGFDPATNQFRYNVNPQFGSTAISQRAFRAPFGITIDFRMYVGPDRETQGIEGALRPTPLDSTTVLSEKQIKAKLSRNVQTPFEQLLRMLDSLKLTPAQVARINAMDTRYLTARDSVYNELAKYLAPLHGDYTGEEVRTHWHTAVMTVYHAIFDQVAELYALFTPEQRSKLPQGFTSQLTLTPSQVDLLFRGPMGSPP